MLGIGLRSNAEAAQQMMSEDLLGTRRFAVVRDDFDQHQVRVGTSLKPTCVYLTCPTRVWAFTLL